MSVGVNSLVKDCIVQRNGTGIAVIGSQVEGCLIGGVDENGNSLGNASEVDPDDKVRHGAIPHDRRCAGRGEVVENPEGDSSYVGPGDGVTAQRPFRHA